MSEVDFKIRPGATFDPIALPDKSVGMSIEYDAARLHDALDVHWKRIDELMGLALYKGWRASECETRYHTGDLKMEFVVDDTVVYRVETVFDVDRMAILVSGSIVAEVPDCADAARDARRNAADRARYADLLATRGRGSDRR